MYNPFEELKQELAEIKRLLQTSQNQQKQETGKSTLSLKETADYTGLTKSYLYKLSSQGAIPCFKPGGKVLRFDKDEIDAWLKRNRKKSNEEIEAEAENHIVNAENRKSDEA